MAHVSKKDYQNAKKDILDESANLEARLRAMYLIKNHGKTYENAKILLEASTKTNSVLLEHELYYNLGQFQLTGAPLTTPSCAAGGGDGVVEGDDIVRFLMNIISTTSPRHDSISRHEALEALGAICADPMKGHLPSQHEQRRERGKDAGETRAGIRYGAGGSSAGSLRAEIYHFLDDVANNERIISVRQSAELARDRLVHADDNCAAILAKRAAVRRQWLDTQRNGGDDDSASSSSSSDDEDAGAPSDATAPPTSTADEKKAQKKAAKHCFETKWVCPSQVHHYLSVDPSPAFDDEEKDAVLASYKRWQNAEKTAARVKELALILSNEVPLTAEEVIAAEEEASKGRELEEKGSSSSNAVPTAGVPATKPGSYSLFDRYRAMFSLRNIGNSDAIEILSASLNTDKSSALFRHEIAFVLGQIEKNSCEAALIQCLSNPKEAGMVRHEAAIAIGGIAQPAGLAALEASSKDRDAIVSDSCIAGLEMHRYWADFMEKIRAANEAREREEEEKKAAVA